MRTLLFVVLLCNFFAAQAQQKSFTVKYITDPIKLDGVLDEAVWETADIATNFWQYFPTDSPVSDQKQDQPQ